MWLVLVFALAGALAQLIDGTLGMGFGVTSATVLLLLGVAPATASAATHAAKLPTTLVSGLSHWHVGNVDVGVLWRIAIPGMISGFLGAVVLTNISLAAAKTWMAVLLIFFGVLIFAKFGFGRSLFPTPANGHRSHWLMPIGLLGGFVDATGGGGWGPVVTPSLLTVTAHEPRKVVGTVSLAEFMVAASASTGFVLSFAGITSSAEHEGIPWLPVLGLCIGGVLMAPIAARLAGRLPHAPMGAMVGGLVVIVNAVTVIAALGGLPWYTDVALLAAAVGVIVRVAQKAWARERAEVTAAGRAAGTAAGRRRSAGP